MNSGWASVLFTGHRIDLPDRRVPRFPPGKESLARAAVRRALVEVLGREARGLCAFSSAACGGDLLFLELCRELAIEAHIILPFAPAYFVETSVKGIGSGHWEERFWRLWQDTPAPRKEILNLAHNSQAFAHCNSRLLERAQARGPFHLIALWDGKGGDGPGGTADLVSRAAQGENQPHIIDPTHLNPEEQVP